MTRHKVPADLTSTEIPLTPVPADAEPAIVPDNGKPAKKKSPLPTDPMLLATAKLDRLLRAMTPNMRKWAVAWLSEKYGGETFDPASVLSLDR